MPQTTQQVTDVAGVDHYLSLAWAGGGNVIIRDGSDEGEVVANSPIALNVVMGTFRGFAGQRRVRSIIDVTSENVVAPTGGSVTDLRRIDTVQYTLGTGLNIKTGVDDASPVAPTKDADSILVAHIYCRNGMVSIKDADDSANGYIVDQREFG